jgi:hypothetical protein
VKRRLKIDLNIGPAQADNCHGRVPHKSLIVLHETVSPQYPGLADIRGVSSFLDAEDYGIHGITDNDGHIAYAKGYGRCIFYHAASGNGMVNTRGIGIEQISRVMLDYRDRPSRIRAWLHMEKELNATAKLMAAISNTHGIPLVDSNAAHPGVTTHWEVTHTYGVVGGHTDCWPSHLGGYYPKRLVIKLAVRYKELGYVLPPVAASILT